MEEELQEVYGSYRIPEEVHQLHLLEIELQKEGLSLERIGLIPIIENSLYSITPPDLIPFAQTGGDGIHFGFLTDFSKVTNLKNAPIVCVSPTNDPPIRFVARSIREFISLAVSVPYVEMIEQFWAIQDESQMIELIQEVADDLPDTLQKKRTLIFNRLQQTLEVEQMDVLNYLQQVKIERKEKIVIPTLDGLGIIGHNNGQSYSFAVDRSCNEEELQRMHDFLNAANTEEKLAFIRDANYWYILAPGYDEAMVKFIIALLQSLNLQDEANRVSSKI